MSTLLITGFATLSTAILVVVVYRALASGVFAERKLNIARTESPILFWVALIVWSLIAAAVCALFWLLVWIDYKSH